MTINHPHHSRPSVAYALRWPALFVILAAEVMDLLDALITSIAGPIDPSATSAAARRLIQWLGAGLHARDGQSACSSAAGSATSTAGGGCSCIGAAGFTVTSLACALAQSPEMLIALRGSRRACSAR